MSLGREKMKIPNLKFQAPNKFQAPIIQTEALFGISVIGIYLIFGAWNLEFYD
jgi:hypothetical protein